jgi:hypothetical protein
MNKEFTVPSVVPKGCNDKPSTIEVEVFDEWNKLKKEEQKALTDLMTHYLQKRWEEQYKKLVNKEQKTIGFVYLQLHALEDLKKDINYKIFYNDLGSLSRNILQAHERLQGMQVKDPVQCKKASSSMLASIQEMPQPNSSKRP